MQCIRVTFEPHTFTDWLRATPLSIWQAGPSAVTPERVSMITSIGCLRANSRPAEMNLTIVWIGQRAAIHSNSCMHWSKNSPKCWCMKVIHCRNNTSISLKCSLRHVGALPDHTPVLRHLRTELPTSSNPFRQKYLAVSPTLNPVTSRMPLSGARRPPQLMPVITQG